MKSERKSHSKACRKFSRKLRKLPWVEDATGLKKSSIYKKMAEGTFPRPVRLSSRAVAWKSDDVERWIDERPVVEAAV